MERNLNFILPSWRTYTPKDITILNKYKIKIQVYLYNNTINNLLNIQ